MDEKNLIEKLQKIEALYAGATTPGEKIAAENARTRICEKLRVLQNNNAAIEYQFTMTDMWSKKLFIALLRRYNLKPYRYNGQRYTTVMVNVPKTFVDDILWPEFQELNKILHSYLEEITDRLIKTEIHGNDKDVEIKSAPPKIP